MDKGAQYRWYRDISAGANISESKGDIEPPILLSDAYTHTYNIHTHHIIHIRVYTRYVQYATSTSNDDSKRAWGRKERIDRDTHMERERMGSLWMTIA